MCYTMPAMKQISEQMRLVRTDQGLLHREMDGETFISTIDGSASFVLNQVGTLIWDLADGQHTIAEIASAICTRYGVAPETALQDTLELAEKLIERKLAAIIGAETNASDREKRA